MQARTLMAALAGALLTAAMAAGGAGAEELKPGRSIRYTAGVTRSSGWEQTLVEKNPNLGKFYWSPITSYGQAYRKAPLPARKPTAANPNAVVRPAGSIYVKPVHVPAPGKEMAPLSPADNVRGQLVERNGQAVRGYARPVHLPLPANQSASASGDVSGRLLPPGGRRSQAAAARTLTYPGYGAGAGNGAIAESTEVHGRLLR